MKRYHTIIIGSLLLAVLTASCTHKPQNDDNTLYVSILPLKSIVSGIVGDDFDVRVLVPAGASPETFEPTPRQYADLNRAGLIFNVGLLDFETTLLGKFEAQEKVIDLSHGIDLITGSCSHAHGKEAAHVDLFTNDQAEETNENETLDKSDATTGKTESGHSHAHGIDPHIWTSPKALQRMAENAYEAIHALWPDSVKYTENHARLQERLAALDARTAEKIAASGVTYFVIYHPALTYYARDYGLRQVSIENEGKEPSARAIARLIEQARRDGIRTIFYQSQFPASSVEVIARDIGAQSTSIDPLKEDVIANIDSLTDLITVQ